MKDQKPTSTLSCSLSFYGILGDGIKVYFVDGDQVRDSLEQDFTEDEQNFVALVNLGRNG